MTTIATNIELHPHFFPRMAWKTVRCRVRPRYTPGSPGMVSEQIALQVAREEKEGYQASLDGLYGDAQKQRAQALGLRRIAYVMVESGSGKKFRWLVQDLITGECYRRHNDADIRQLGFSAFIELPPSVKREIMAGGCSYSDYNGTFWKRQVGKYVEYEPEFFRGL